MTRLATLRVEGSEQACLQTPAGFLPLNSRDLEKLGSRSLSGNAVLFAPLHRRPSKIWGIGLSYWEHAADLDEQTPTGEPASFMKPDSTIIRSGDLHDPRQPGARPEGVNDKAGLR